MGTLTLKKKPPPAATSSAPTVLAAPPPVPLDASQFYFIWRVGGHRPKQRHPDLAAAIAECRRLQAEQPNNEFYIFRAIKENV